MRKLITNVPAKNFAMIVGILLSARTMKLGCKLLAASWDDTLVERPDIQSKPPEISAQVRKYLPLWNGEDIDIDLRAIKSRGSLLMDLRIH